MELGRFDGRVSTCGSVVVPHGSFDLDQLNAFFSGLGLNQTDMIALSGTNIHAHVCMHIYIQMCQLLASGTRQEHACMLPCLVYYYYYYY